MEKHIKVHIIYIFGILIATIVSLITIKWGNIPNLVELFSFALTISSIILAILAIAYAVYSNTSFGKNIAVLDKASNDIGSSTKYLEEISNDLKDKFNDLPDLLKTLHQKTDSNQSLLTELSKQSFEKQQATFIKSDAIAEESIKNIVTKTSINGHYILYILKLAKDSKKEFTPKDISENTRVNLDYLLGYTGPLRSLGLVKIEIKYEKGGFKWQVLDLHDDIYDNIIESISELWSEHKKEGHLEFVLDGINDIRIYFDLPPISKDKDFS